MTRNVVLSDDSQFFWFSESSNCPVPLKFVYPEGKKCDCFKCQKKWRSKYFRHVIKYRTTQLKNKCLKDRIHPHFLRGLAYFGTGEYKLAMADFTFVIEQRFRRKKVLCRDHLMVSYFKRARCLEKYRKFSAAFLDYDACLLFRNNYYEAIIGRVRSLKRPTFLQQFEGVFQLEKFLKESIDQGRRISSDVEKSLHQEIGKLYRGMEVFEKSIEHLDKAIAIILPNDCVCPNLEKSRTLFEMGKYKECYQDVEMAFHSSKKSCEGRPQVMSKKESLILRSKCLLKMAKSQDMEGRKIILDDCEIYLKRAQQMVVKIPQISKKKKKEHIQYPCSCRFDDYSEILKLWIVYYRKRGNLTVALRKCDEYDRIFSSRNFDTMVGIFRNCVQERQKVYRGMGEVNLCIETLKKSAQEGNLVSCINGNDFCQEIGRLKEAIQFINLEKSIYSNLMSKLDSGEETSLPLCCEEEERTPIKFPSQRWSSLSVWSGQKFLFFGNEGQEITPSECSRYFFHMASCDENIASIYEKMQDLKMTIRYLKKSLHYSSMEITNTSSSENQLETSSSTAISTQKMKKEFFKKNELERSEKNRTEIRDRVKNEILAVKRTMMEKREKEEEELRIYTRDNFLSDDSNLLMSISSDCFSTVSNKNKKKKKSSGDGIKKICAFCKKPRKKMKKCGGCKSVMYCSLNHQKLHWKKKHRFECVVIKLKK